MGEDPLYEKAKGKALQLLSVRARSVKELGAKLKEKGFDETVVEKITERFRELKYLDDESFAGQWARNLGVNKLLGNRRIESSLREKGIQPLFIEKAINDVRREISEADAIVALIRKKVKSHNIMKLDYGEKRRIAWSLMGKGFPPDLIFEMLNQSKEDFVNEGE